MKPTENTLLEVEPDPANAIRNRCRENAPNPSAAGTHVRPPSQLPGSGCGCVPVGSRAQVIVVSFTSSEGWDGCSQEHPWKPFAAAEPGPARLWALLVLALTKGDAQGSGRSPASHYSPCLELGTPGPPRGAERRAPGKAEGEGLPPSSDPLVKLPRPAQATCTNRRETGTTGTRSVTGLVPSSQRRRRHP